MFVLEIKGKIFRQYSETTEKKIILKTLVFQLDQN